ncbi:magnesium transporter CorA family protein [Vallitalea okinawensis]|uniref:magnesium transporter CorA family protein n=1 Tax=Vallitalea okinawensis TaxID=2078660 RepID=UPI000CFCD973|nr:magnesium transporter CorA family protein [Vallitalea okinawensis]
MIKILKTIDNILIELDELEDGVWINLSGPSEEDIKRLTTLIPDLNINHLKAALDREECAHVEKDQQETLIIVDVPIESDDKYLLYTTIPLGIILMKEYIITICMKPLPLLNEFITGQIKEFYTYMKTRFILQILNRNAIYFLRYLRTIEKYSDIIERELHKSMKNKELIQLLALEKSLVYFSTSLTGNEVVLEKMLKMDHIKKYPEDQRLLEDVIIENKQAIVMANIYSNILSGTMDAFASVISNNLNIVMKFLTSVTIILSIPTMVASFFGMNVPVPLSDNPVAFLIIILISLVLSILLYIIMTRNKML